MFDHVENVLQDFPGVTSVLVAQHGATALEWYVEGVDGATALRNTRSVTKSVTGMLVGVAVDAGLIDLEASVASYLGDRAAGASPDAPTGVSIGDLLTMSSCLDCDDSVEASPGNEERMYPKVDWLAFARSIPLRTPCGAATFRYCTAHTVLLAAAVEAATGVEFSEYADARLFDPLGISDRRWFRSDAGFAFPGGGLELRSRDLLALGVLYLNGGMCDGRWIISANWVTRSTTPHVGVDDRTNYGYLLWLRRLTASGSATDAWLMLGNGGNMVAVLPQLGAVVVITAVNFGKPGMHQLTERLLVEHALPELVSRAHDRR